MLLLFFNCLITITFGIEKCDVFSPEDFLCPAPCFFEVDYCVGECSDGYVLNEENTTCVFDCSSVLPEGRRCPDTCFVEWDACVNACGKGFSVSILDPYVCSPSNCSLISPINNKCPADCFFETNKAGEGKCSLNCSSVLPQGEVLSCPEPCFVEWDICVNNCEAGYTLDSNVCTVSNCTPISPKGEKCPTNCLVEGLMCVEKCSEYYIIDITNPTECIPRTCEQYEPTEDFFCHRTINSACFFQNSSNSSCVSDCDEDFRCVSDCDDDYRLINSQCRRTHECEKINVSSEDCQWTCFVQNSQCVYSCSEGYSIDINYHFCVQLIIPKPPKDYNVIITIVVVLGLILMGCVIAIGVVCAMRRRKGGRAQYQEVPEPYE